MGEEHGHSQEGPGRGPGGGAWRGIRGRGWERGRWKRGWKRGWGRAWGGPEGGVRKLRVGGYLGCLWRHPTYTETPAALWALTAFRQGGARKAGTGTAEHRAPGGGGGGRSGPLLKHLGRTLSSPPDGAAG